LRHFRLSSHLVAETFRIDPDRTAWLETRLEGFHDGARAAAGARG
jgi:hypothetical protein